MRKEEKAADETALKIARSLGLNGAQTTKLRNTAVMVANPEAYRVRGERATATAIFAQLGLNASDADAPFGGLKGRQVMDEAIEEARAEVPDGATPEEIAGEASQALEAYLDDSGDDDAWQHLARAGAFVVLALDACAPAYANRHGADDDQKNGEGGLN